MVPHRLVLGLGPEEACCAEVYAPGISIDCHVSAQTAKFAIRLGLDRMREKARTAPVPGIPGGKGWWRKGAGEGALLTCELPEIPDVKAA